MSKRLKRGTPKRAPKKKAVPKTRALARRVVAGEVVPPIEHLAGLPASVPLVAAPAVSVGFVGTLKLSEDQIKALRRPVQDDEVDWKPSRKQGPRDLPYLSHNGYRDRLDAAFGLGGWGMAPTGTPQEKDGIVYVPYALVIDGVPRVYAWGEMAYHPKGHMTYGDALEGCKSNAITRTAKELGVAREMWDRDYLEELKARVPLTARGGAWSAPPDGGDPLGDSPYPDPAEMGADRPRRQAPARPPVQEHTHAHAGEPITQKQRQRLFLIGRNAGREDAEIGKWLLAAYGYKGTDQIKRSEYDAICRAVESREDLPAGKAR